MARHSMGLPTIPDDAAVAFNDLRSRSERLFSENAESSVKHVSPGQNKNKSVAKDPIK